jgi:cyclophilin family peptidyl-prolyl cis-trans isomerase
VLLAVVTLERQLLNSVRRDRQSQSSDAAGSITTANRPAVRQASHVDHVLADQLLPTAPMPSIDLDHAGGGVMYFNLTAHLETDHGSMVWGLHDGAAPLSVANFLSLVHQGFHNKSCIYRYERGFVLQGGGCAGHSSKQTVPLEYNLPNVKHSVALARSSNPHSGGSEWFINLRDNTQSLGPRKKGGYAVFAHVLDGFDTITKLKQLKTHKAGSLTVFEKPVPKIRHAYIIDHRNHVGGQ